MRVLHVLSQHQLTGAEVYAFTLGQAQQAQGDELWGVSDTFTLPFPGKVYLLPIGRRTWLQRLRNVIALVRLIRREKIHLIHAHSRAAAWVAWFAAKLTGTPLVSTVHGLSPVHRSARQFRVYGRHVIAVCKKVREQLVQELGYAPDHVRVIPNGFPPETWNAPVLPAERWASPFWLYVGRFTPHKGEVALRVLQAWAQLPIELRRFDLHLIGGTKIPPALQELADRINQQAGRQELHLHDFEQAIHSWMQAASVVIGAGRVAIEGLLSGKPVIAFGETGYWGLITPDNLQAAIETNFGDMGGPPWPSAEGLAAEWTAYLRRPISPLPGPLTEKLRRFYQLDRVEKAVRRTYEEARLATLPPIPVLCYHRIVEKPLEGRLAGLGVPVYRFARQLEALHQGGFSTLTFRDVVAYLEGRAAFPSRPLILTFDDGYEDNYSLAFPLLQRYGMRAVIFAVTDFSRRWNFWDPDAAPAPLLTPAQLREMADGGIEFGAHTVTHPHLPRVPLAQARQELEESRKILEDLVGQPVVSFAYPYGELSREVASLVAETGYRFAVTNDRGVLRWADNPWALGRVQVFPWTSAYGLWKKTRRFYLLYRAWKRVLREGSSVQKPEALLSLHTDQAPFGTCRRLEL